MEICSLLMVAIYPSIFIGGIVVGLIISIIFFTSKFKNIKDIKKSDKTEITESELDNTEIKVSKLENNISELLRYVESLEKNVISLNNELLSLNDQLLSCKDKLSELHEKDNDNSTDELKLINSAETESIPIVKPTIYFSIPSTNLGDFNLKNSKESNDGKCFYSIVETSNNRGELSYLSSERDLQAIDSYSNYLFPVCDIENFSDKSNAKNIQMLEKGQVFLENESWIIDKNNKVKIKFL